jgi:hypothetical protein
VAPASSLPGAAPLERYLRAHALHDAETFAAALPGPAVLVRVDERGGVDEVAPWAFPRPELMPPPGVEDVFVDIALTSMTSEATATGPVQPTLPRPPARERASVVVVPPGGGALGRAPGSAVRVGERSVSRHHADLVVDGGVWFVVDRGSDNGTGVNGLALVPDSPQRVRSGDVLQLGDVVLLFLDAASFHAHLPTLAGDSA